MCDCLIIGGGVIGLSIAYELARHGLKLRVIDRARPGREASWAGAGILPPANSKTAVHAVDHLRGLSYDLHAQWAEALQAETGIDNGYRRCGGIYLARSAGEAVSLAGLQALLSEEQVQVERLAPGRLAEVEPALKDIAESGKLKAAYWLPDEAQLRNPHHLKALLTACEQRGVDVRTDAEAEEFLHRGGRITGVRTRQGELTADRYCITAGAWTQRLLQQLGIATGILPIRGQMVLFACNRQPFRPVINEGPRYLVPREDGHVLAGSTEEEAGFDKRTTEEGIAELKQFACEIVSELRQAKIERTWAGLRPGSYDGFPYLGPVPGLENVFVAAGHFRSGLFLSTGTAVLMGQLIRGRSPQIDLSPFRAGRG